MLYIYIYIYSVWGIALIGMLGDDLRERFEWVKAEQQLPGAFRKRAKDSEARYFWLSKSFGKLRF